MKHLKLNLNRTMWWWLILALPSFSCSNYFKPVVAKASTSEEISNVIKANTPDRYFILRQEPNSYAIKNISLDNVAGTLNGTLTEVDKAHLKYVNATDRSEFKYKKDESLNLLNEVHIFSKSTFPVDMSKGLSLPLKQIAKIETIEYDAKRTSTNHTLTAVGIAVGAGGVAALIVVTLINSIDMSLNSSGY